VGLVFFLIIALQNWKVREMVLMKMADSKSLPKSVKTVQEIDAKLSDLEKQSFSKLDESYLNYSKSLDGKYHSLLKDKNYYVLVLHQVNSVG